MGLDMYAFITSSDIPAVDFAAPDDRSELHYWRKHPDLHGWMRDLYHSRGGADDEFNCAPVRLDAPDLEALEQALKSASLPHTQGFFFGASNGSERADDLHFIHKARDALASGKRIFYWIWW